MPFEIEIDPEDGERSLMPLQSYVDRVNQERYRWICLYHEERVYRVERIKPRLAPAFAEMLILCLSEQQARDQIRQDPAGAAGFGELVGRILSDMSTEGISAEPLPSGELTPFYALCSLVIEAAKEDWDLPDGPRRNNDDSDALPI